MRRNKVHTSPSVEDRASDGRCLPFDGGFGRWRRLPSQLYRGALARSSAYLFACWLVYMYTGSHFGSTIGSVVSSLACLVVYLLVCLLVRQFTSLLADSHSHLL
jgi:hypothetical protein